MARLRDRTPVFPCRRYDGRTACRKPASFAVALYCGMGSSSLNALVKHLMFLNPYLLNQQRRPFSAACFHELTVTLERTLLDTPYQVTLLARDERKAH